MNIWRPYLTEVLGDDEHGQEEVHDAIVALKSFSEERFTADNLILLLDWVETFDAFRQVFILPAALELIADRSPSLRHRVLGFASELMGSSIEALKMDLDRMVRAEGSGDKCLRRVLIHAGEILLKSRWDEVEADADGLESLLDTRMMIFGVSLLNGLFGWLEQRTDSEQLKRVYRDYFDEDEQIPLRDKLLEILGAGPLYLRYLFVTWIGRSGVELSTKINVRQLLYSRYRYDLAPPVAAAAVESYARRTELSFLSTTLDRLELELRTFHERQVPLRRLPPLSRFEVARGLSVGLLNAIGLLARHHPTDARARAVLRRIAETKPTNRLDLLESHPRQYRESILKAAMALRGRSLFFRVRNIRLQGKRFVGDVGLGRSVNVGNAVSTSTDSNESFWCKATTGSGQNFRIVEPFSSEASTQDLLGVIAPRIESVATCKPPRSATDLLARACGLEISERGAWSLAAFEAVAGALLAVQNVAGSLDAGHTEVSSLYTFLVHTAEAAEQARVQQGRADNELRELKNRVRAILLNNFADETFFARLFSGGEADHLRAKLLTSLATSAMRSLDDEVAYGWIRGNLELLTEIAVSSDYWLYERGLAAAAVQLRIRDFGEGEEARIVIDHDEEKLTGATRRTIPFVSDAKLQATYTAINKGVDLAALAAQPEGVKNSFDQIIVRSEVVARALEGGADAWKDVKDNVAICLAAAAAPNRRLLPETARRRLAGAFVAAPAERRTGAYQRLFAQLVRTGTAAQLLAIQRLTLLRDDHHLEQYLGLLMERHLATWDSGLDVTGRFRDTQALIDETSKPSVVTGYLHRLALKSEEFIFDYIQRRNTRRLGETDRVVAASGAVRSMRGIPEDLLPAELKPLRSGSMTDNIAERATDIVPTFVHHIRGGAHVQCLSALKRVPEGTLDLHVPSLSERERRALLSQLLNEGRRLLLATRVVGGTAPNGATLLDLGVVLAGLPRQIEVSLGQEVKPDDAVVVQVRRRVAGIRVLTNGQFELALPTVNGDVADLRRRQDAVEWLEKNASRVTLHLRATVVEWFEHDDGTVRCFCNPGFTIHDDRRDRPRNPSFVTIRASAPVKGAEFVLAASNFSFRTISDGGPIRDTVEVVTSGGGLEEGQIVSGYLRQARGDNGRREWWVEVGGARLSVPRRHLTADLRYLFELDEVDDYAAVFERLKQETVEVRVRAGGAASVTQTSPNWVAEDLIVAVGVGLVDNITVVRNEQGPRKRIVAELLPVTSIGEDTGSTPIGPLGALALLRQGELFDRSGEPVVLETLQPGTRLSLAVWERDGRGATRSGERRRPRIHLRLTEDPDQVNLELEKQLSENDIVSVQVARSGELELADSPGTGLPSPGVQLQRAEDRRHFPPDTTVDALVARTWDPWALDYQVEVRSVRSYPLHIDETNELQQLRFLLNLGPGDRIDKRYRYEKDRGGLVCYAGGLRIGVDSQTFHLLPRPSELHPHELRSQVVLTDVGARKSRETFPAEALDEGFVAEVARQETMTGIVSAVPHKKSKSSQVQVRWILGEVEAPSGEEHIEVHRGVLDPGERYYNGDVLTARLQGGRAVIQRRSRFLKGTFLHSITGADSWLNRALRQRRELVAAVLLERSGNGQENWLFCIEPADLVEIPAGSLGEAEIIEDAHPLDRVKLRVVRGTRGDAVFQVESVEEGPLAAARGRRLELELRWYNPSTGEFQAELRGGGPLSQYPALELKLPQSSLPPREDLRQLVRETLSGKKPVVECTIEAFELRTWREGGFRFELVCTLGGYESEQEASTGPSKPVLVDILSQRGRVDGARGRIVKQGNDLGVVLSAYTHDAALPLPLDEQTWLPLTGKLPRPGDRYSFTVVPDEDGSPLASLRRSRPRTLEQWLEKRRYGIPSGTVHVPMHYCGPLSDADRKECGVGPERDESTEELEPEDDFALFEIGPGETFIAPFRQLRFLGERFHPKTLRRGDEISEFEVVQGRTDEVQGSAILDILSFTLDIVEDLQRFENGSLYGKVAVGSTGVQITELRGVSYSERQVSEHRVGRWRLNLADSPDPDLDRLRNLGEDQFVYLKFLRPNYEARILLFRLVTTREIFTLNHFVYVKAREVGHYGEGSWKLNVRPLDGSMAEEYFIPESLFSARRGRRSEAEDLAEKRAVLLARVHEVPEEDITRGAGSAFKLTLLRNPTRRFRYMMSHREWQVIVKEVSPDQAAFQVEAGIGVNVELPVHRIESTAAAGEKEGDETIPRRGEVLFLDRVRKERRLIIRDAITSHLDYLPVKERPFVLVNLWGSKDYRRERVKRGSLTDCNIVGLPQLRGLCRISEENLGVELHDSIPAQVESLARGGRSVRLTDRLQSRRYLVGRLSFDENCEPQFDAANTGRTYRPTLGEISYREETAQGLAAALAALRWRDSSMGESRSIAESDLIGLFLDDQATASFTAMVHQPFPVDHLVEQFAVPGLQELQGIEPRKFVVGRVDGDRVVLELAPGRYAELPTALIQPLHQDVETRLARGLNLSWKQLAGGDEILLELKASKDIDAFLPRFRIRELLARSGRQLARPVAAPLCRRPDGELVLGTMEGPAVAARHVSGIPVSEVQDLRRIRNERRRYFELKELFEKLGPRLVLKGAVRGIGAVDGGRFFFIDIGVRIPVGGKRLDPNIYIAGSGSSLEKGQSVGVRILGATFVDDKLEALGYVVETNLNLVSKRIPVRGAEANLVAGVANPSDSVLIYHLPGTPEGHAVAAGFEHLELFWQPTPGDDLHLHVPSERQEVLLHILKDGGFFWATCEGIDNRRLTVSRRLQLQDTIPEAGEVVRAKVVGALSRSRWLLFLYGVPMVILSERLFRGPTIAVDQLSDEYRRNFPDGVDVEVVKTADGRLSANEVYHLQPVSEIEARIEAVIEAGVMVVGTGSRFFIPSSELTWCGDLDEHSLRSLFRIGSRLRIAPLNGRDYRWSHIATYDIRSAVAEMRKTHGAVSVTAVLRDGNRVIVRGSSGVLMELIPDREQELGVREIAFVEHIDEASRRIRLTSEPVPRSNWSLPDLGVTPAHRFAAHSQDALAFWLADLRADLAHEGSTAIIAWARRHPELSTDPESVRLVLDVIRTTPLPSPSAEAIGSAPETGLSRLFRRIAPADSGDAIEENELSEDELFALGYRLLLKGKEKQSLAYLKKLEGTETISRSFVVGLTLAVTYGRNGQKIRATERLRQSLWKLWANAVRTIEMPLIKPSSLDPLDENIKEWDQAIAHGDFKTLEAIVCRQPADFRISSAGLGFEIWRAVTEDRLVGFTDLVERFLDALRIDEEESGGVLNPQVCTLAAYLEFCRGNVVEGWGWLDRVNSHARDIEVAAFWRRYLGGDPDPEGLDPVLVAAAKVFRRCRWSHEVDLDSIESLWEAYRNSQHRWRLDIPVCRALSPMPISDEAALERWAKLHGVGKALVSLLDLVDLERAPTAAGQHTSRE